MPSKTHETAAFEARITAQIEGLKASLSSKGSDARKAEKDAQDAANRAAIESVPATLRGEIKAHLAGMSPGSKYTVLSMSDAPVEIVFTRTHAFVKTRNGKGGLEY